MVVELYDPHKFFGFCYSPQDPRNRVFFHASVFSRLDNADRYPPIPGEAVEVIVRDEPVSPGKSPKAFLVRRLAPLKTVMGRVRSFDHRNGWGFIEDEEGRVCFLHRADFVEGSIPIIGDDVVFIEGRTKDGRVRACCVSIAKF